MNSEDMKKLLKLAYELYEFESLEDHLGDLKRLRQLDDDSFALWEKIEDKENFEAFYEKIKEEHSCYDIIIDDIKDLKNKRARAYIIKELENYIPVKPISSKASELFKDEILNLIQNDEDFFKVVFESGDLKDQAIIYKKLRSSKIESIVDRDIILAITNFIHENDLSSENPDLSMRKLIRNIKSYKKYYTDPNFNFRNSRLKGIDRVKELLGYLETIIRYIDVLPDKKEKAELIKMYKTKAKELKSDVLIYDLISKLDRILLSFTQDCGSLKQGGDYFDEIILKTKKDDLYMSLGGLESPERGLIFITLDSKTYIHVVSLLGSKYVEDSVKSYNYEYISQSSYINLIDELRCRIIGALNEHN